jgi:transposase
LTTCQPTRSAASASASRRREPVCSTSRPYSPDFNPIEQAFAKLNTLLRTAAARTIPDLWATIKRALTRFQPAECRNYLAAAGYDAT